MSAHEKLDGRDLRYLKFVFGRAQNATDGQLVTELSDPEIDSPQILYRRLSNDGYPVCPECGEAPIRGKHCDPPEKKKRSRRATQGGGGVQKLPSPKAATYLFQEALRSLQRDVDKLSHRRDYLKDGRFVAENVLSGERGEAWKTHRRGDLSEEAWRKYCDEYSADPGCDEFDEPIDSVQPAGTSHYPPEPLTRLIATYVLSGYPPDLLLAKLHPDPEAIDPETTDKLDRHIRDGQVGLKKAAGTVARLIRGGPVKTGPPKEGLSPREEDARAYIEVRRRESASDAQILEELRSGHGFRRPVRFGVVSEGRAWSDMTMSDVQRLGKLSQ